MGRKKILIDYIVDDKKRLSTFEKRRIGLFKKANELSKLCNVNVSVFIFKNKSSYRYNSKGLNKFYEKFGKLNEFSIEEDFTTDSLQTLLCRKTISGGTAVARDTTDVVKNDSNRMLLSELEDDIDEEFLNTLGRNGVLDLYKNIRPDEAVDDDVEEQTSVFTNYGPSNDTTDQRKNSQCAEIKSPENSQIYTPASSTILPPMPNHHMFNSRPDSLYFLDNPSNSEVNQTWIKSYKDNFSYPVENKITNESLDLAFLETPTTEMVFNADKIVTGFNIDLK